MACLDVSHERSGDTCSARTRTHTFAHKPLQAVLAPLSVDFGRRPMNITLVMSSSITTTLIMGAGLAVGAAVADGELGSVMGSMLLNVHVPTTHTTSQMMPCHEGICHTHNALRAGLGRSCRSRRSHMIITTMLHGNC